MVVVPFSIEKTLLFAKKPNEWVDILLCGNVSILRCLCSITDCVECQQSMSGMAEIEDRMRHLFRTPDEIDGETGSLSSRFRSRDKSIQESRRKYRLRYDYIKRTLRKAYYERQKTKSPVLCEPEIDQLVPIPDNHKRHFDRLVEEWCDIEAMESKRPEMNTEFKRRIFSIEETLVKRSRYDYLNEDNGDVDKEMSSDDFYKYIEKQIIECSHIKGTITY